ncbi:MAG: mannose-1-phosphate guanylyltransferase/mannose-6-phosphate isomerase [Gammaproteobacteria bacterium]|nr:mannose-1-phosphate guanylyltransferase/mannose-6-phosphate isomerase [bacterium AH-315-E07]PCH60592.1 MAG: mannose-1-phosphate guanylyltransferase/mannose-6-phosphate isomerase [Gammaproteobacteria bacterium]
MTTIQPVILSGGSGSRLWPLSREHYPKQLLALVGKNSLLQDTVDRLDQDNASDITARNPLLVCNEEHRFLVAEQLRQIDVSASSIILESVGRNTAPALTLAALAVSQKGNDDVMLVMPADHVIRDAGAFHDAIFEGAQLANDGVLVTFGIVPSHAETGYGYIKSGASAGANGKAFVVEKFVEKPDVEMAMAYLASGDYFWNSGIFMMRASAWLKAIECFRSDISDVCRASFDKGTEDNDFFRADSETFKACPSDSIDYAVMEKATGDDGFPVAVIPIDVGWSDVGAWSSLWDVSERDGEGNVIKGDVVTKDTKNSLLISEHRLVTGVGIEDMIVVETADAVMVAHKSRTQDVKSIVEGLKSSGRSEYQSHRRVYRPWGSYESIDFGERFQVKRIIVNPGASLSLQMHHHRAEHWIVVQGTARVTCGEEDFLLSENQSTYIPLGVKHRLENPGSFALELIEVQSGSYLGEDDIVRFDDVYGRAN